MPIRAKTNRYPGVNPHLNSWLQRSGDRWRSFHGKHITYMAEILDTALHEGYYTRDEASLNIGRIDLQSGDNNDESTIPDVSIYREQGQKSDKTSAPLSTPTLTLPLPKPVEPFNEPRAVVIYRVGDTDDEPITRIEVLSPANKPGGSYYGTYMKKRELTLKSGLCIVEIDYLHEGAPIVAQIPNYAAQDDHSLPYHILISVPRPTYSDGFTHVHSAGALEALPTLPLPLAGDDTVIVDFTVVYNRIYEAVRQYRTVVAYEQEPGNFAAYRPDDQAKILAQMAKIAAEHSSNT